MKTIFAVMVSRSRSTAKRITGGTEMKVKTYLTDKEGLEPILNDLGYENVLNIIPCVEYDTTLFMVICNAESKELQEKQK